MWQKMNFYSLSLISDLSEMPEQGSRRAEQDDSTHESEHQNRAVGDQQTQARTEAMHRNHRNRPSTPRAIAMRTPQLTILAHLAAAGELQRTVATSAVSRLRKRLTQTMARCGGLLMVKIRPADIPHRPTAVCFAPLSSSASSLAPSSRIMLAARSTIPERAGGRANGLPSRKSTRIKNCGISGLLFWRDNPSIDYRNLEKSLLPHKWPINIITIHHNYLMTTY